MIRTILLEQIIYIPILVKSKIRISDLEEYLETIQFKLSSVEEIETHNLEIKDLLLKLPTST